jgi:hypothetical protein
VNVAPSDARLPLADSDNPMHPTNTADDGHDQQTRRTTIGHSTIEYSQAASILSKATGFIDAFDYTLDPYSGCTFGCTYCYAAFFTRNHEQQDSWGHWVRVKENALDLLKRKRTKPLTGKTIFMSSVTDPYGGACSLHPPHLSLGLLVPQGDHTLEHVGKHRVGNPRGNAKRNDLLVKPGRPLEATHAAHDCTGCDSMRRVDPICRHL